MTQPDISMAICATPRSASNQLCSALHHVGFGMPREFMHWSKQERQGRDFSIQFNPARSADYLAHLRKHFTRNKVFAAKVFYTDSLSIYPGLLQTFEGGHFLHLERKDIASQIISLAALIKTGRPLDSEVEIGPKIAQEIDARLLRYLEMLIVTSNAFWRKFLVGRRALHIYTENLIGDPETAARQIFEFTGRNSFSVDAFRDYVTSHKSYLIDRELKDEIKFNFKDALLQIKERHER